MSEKKHTTENKKVEDLYVTREMAEDENMDRELREGIIKATDKMEQELKESSIPNLDDDPEKKQEILQDIVWELRRKGLWEEEEDSVSKLSPEDQKALEIGRKMLHNRKSMRMRAIGKGIAGVAIVLAGTLTLSMSSEANRKRAVYIWNSIVGEELRIGIDSDEIEQMGQEEQEAYDIIEKEIGIRPLRILYIPEGLQYDGYITDNKNGNANLFYKYKENYVTVFMYNKNVNVDRIQQFDGKVVDSVKIMAGSIEVDIFKISDSLKENYVSYFSFEDGFYIIWGSMPEESFKKMLENAIL